MSFMNIIVQGIPNWYLHFEMVIIQEQKIMQNGIILTPHLPPKKCEKYTILQVINFIWE